jgi:hypothetical protein
MGRSQAILMPNDPVLPSAVNEWLTPIMAAGQVERMAQSYLK